MVQSLELSLSSGAARAKKAPGILIVQVMAMEALVCDLKAAPGLRAFVWVKLIKLWGSLGTDGDSFLPT
eukprot:1170878-Amphidinium_carterae.1